METALTYDDVLLLPQYSDIRSRTEVVISSDLGNGLKLDLPIFASPMDTISETRMAEAMCNAGGAAVLHRYNTIEQQVKMIIAAKNAGVTNIGFAVGVDNDYLDRAEECVKAGATFVCVDVAHGHHIKMKEALKNLRYELGSEIHIMAGNVATLEGINALADWGANSVRCNIGGGCFVPGTLVRGPDGDKAIENLRVGDKVYSHTGQIREVIDTLVFDRDEEIMIIDGIETTKNHEFYVVNVEDADKVNEHNLADFAHWVEAEHLSTDKHLLIEIE